MPGGWRYWWAVVALAASACGGPNLWRPDASVSTGRTNRGFVRKPAQFPQSGPGFVVPTRWKERGFRYGTEELTAAVARAAGRVRRSDGLLRRSVATLGVADFSRNTGGPSRWHASHHSGRDVDVIFFHVDPRGRPMRPPEHGMVRFDSKGEPFLGPREDSYPDKDWALRRFDWRRNWEFVEALLTDPRVRVQWIFVSDPIRDGLLAWAEERQRPTWLIEYARVVLRQPGNAAPHDDHFHIRVYCTRTDRVHGCQDAGPVWQHEKKAFKYHGPERYDPVAWRAQVGSHRLTW